MRLFASLRAWRNGGKEEARTKIWHAWPEERPTETAGQYILRGTDMETGREFFWAVYWYDVEEEREFLPTGFYLNGNLFPERKNERYMWMSVRDLPRESSGDE